MNSYTRNYNFGYLSIDDRLKGNDKKLLKSWAKGVNQVMKSTPGGLIIFWIGPTW